MVLDPILVVKALIIIILIPMKVVLALFLSLCCAGSAPVFAQGDTVLGPSHYKIYDTKQGREVTLEDIVQRMENHEVVLFGEEHNDSVAHYLQVTLMEKLNTRFGEKMALSMEMFDRDVQTVMDEYLGGHIRERQFTKDARVWSNYRDYRPMVELAKAKGLDVICANAASRYTNLAGRQGQEALKKLPKASRGHFAPLPYPIASGAYYDKLMGFMNGGHTPEKDSTGKVKPPVANMGAFDLIAAQSLWDATMAWSIASYAKHKANKGKKIMHVNGRFHSDERMAIFTQLASYAPKLRTLVISCGPSDAFLAPNWEELRIMGDYVIITDPNVPRTYEN